MNGNDFFSRLRARRSALVRTRPRPNLPAAALYLEWLPGASSRKLLDVDGKEHVLADGVIQSNYRLAHGAEGEALIAKHWAKAAPPPQEPVRHVESAPPAPARAAAPVAPVKPVAKPAAAPAKASKKTAAKKPAAKKPAAKKAPAKKPAVKKPAKRK